MAITVTCNPAMLGWLGKAFPNATRMSIFEQFKDVEFNDEDKRSLIVQEIIDEEGNIYPSVYAVLKTLAFSDTAFRIQLIKLSNVSEKTVYYFENQGVSVDQQSGVFTIRYPISIEESIMDYKEFVGDGRYIDVPFNKVGNSDAIKAAITVLDCQRKAVLVGLGSEESIRLNFDNKEIENQIESEQALAIGSWLSVFDGKPSIQKALDEGYLFQKDSALELSEDWLSLSTSCLLLDLVVDLLLIKNVDESNHISRARAFVFDRHNILYIEENRGMMEVSTTSGKDLIEILKNLLQNN
jgi:hypothetical protein